MAGIFDMQNSWSSNLRSDEYWRLKSVYVVKFRGRADRSPMRQWWLNILFGDQYFCMANNLAWKFYSSICFRSKVIGPETWTQNWCAKIHAGIQAPPTTIKEPYLNKSTLDNSPPPNYDKESKDECHHVNNNPRYKWYVKPAAFQVIAPTRSNYGCKINVKNRNKSTILIFLPAIIELVQELLISNMHNKLEEDTC